MKIENGSIHSLASSRPQALHLLIVLHIPERTSLLQMPRIGLNSRNKPACWQKRAML